MSRLLFALRGRVVLGSRFAPGSARPPVRAWSMALALPLAVALGTTGGCNGSTPATGDQPGQTDFESTVPDVGPGRGAGETGDKGGAGGAGGAGAPSPTPPGGAPRTIEEGDVVKVVGTTLYVLNQYRGLQVIDVSTPDDPKLVGRVPLYGAPLEMYVRDGHAFALVSDYWSYWRCDDCAGGAAGFHGSQLAVIDVSNPATAAVSARVQIEGLVTDSRIVGDVMYVVSNRYAWWGWDGASDDSKDLTFVQSIDLAEPGKPRTVDELDFPREGWDNHIHVTDKLLYVASTSYGRWDGGECSTSSWMPCTRITAVDIASSAGAIREGKTVLIEGVVPDRWALDWYEDTLRVLAGQWWSTSDPPKLRTFAAANADQLTPLATTPVYLPRPESVTTTRFDGPTAYLVTVERQDPLWTLDVSDPKKPFVAGHLETPGWLDYIEPRGDRIIALGHDRAADTDPWSLQVSLYDVHDLAKPTMLARRPFGEGWGWIPGQADDFRKIFRVLDDLGMILVPYQSWVPTPAEGGGYWGGHYKGGVQILDFDKDTLALRGFAEHPGWIERAVPYSGRILTVSNELVQVVDATDRDKPVLTGSLELARNATDIVVSGGSAVELAGDWYKGDTRLVVVPSDDPDAPKPSARLDLPAPFGRIFRNGSFVYALSSNWQTGSTRIDVVEIGAADELTRRGSISIPVLADYWGWGGYESFWGSGTEAVQVGGSTLVLHASRWYGCWGDGAGRAAAGEAVPCAGYKGPDADFYVVDLAKPDAPRLASKVLLKEADWVTGSGADGTTFYATHYEVTGSKSGYSTVRYYLDRIDLAHPDTPVVRDKINVPGNFLAVHGSTLYTVEARWEPGTGKVTGALHGLTLAPGGKATLRSTLLLDGSSLSGLAVGEGAAATVVDGDLVTIDLSNPAALKIAARTAVPGLEKHVSGGATYYDWGWARTLTAGRAFVEVGAGILIYDLADLTKPALSRYVRTDGWVQEIRVADGVAYMPSGYYGVERVGL